MAEEGTITFIWLHRKGDKEPFLIRTSEVLGAIPEVWGSALLHTGGQILVTETPKEIESKLVEVENGLS